MFQLFKARKKLDTASPESITEVADIDQSDPYMTEAAIAIIKGRGSIMYRQQMRRLFEKVPTLIGDVDPQYRAALKSALSKK